MIITKALLVVLLAVTIGRSQTNVTISGKVTDSGTVPISGALVKLEKGQLTATSGPDGSFLLSGSTGIINSQFNKPLSGTITVSMHNGYLNLNIREKSNITITTYTLQGKMISYIRKTMEAGSHALALPGMSAGVYFYRISSGKEEVMIKHNSLTGVSGLTGLSNQNPSSTALTRQAKSYLPITDVIAVTKAGYLNYREVVTNSDTSGIEIKLIICEDTVRDADGNVYQAVRIGTQVWTVENFRSTKFNDGSEMPKLPTSLIGYWFCTTDADSIKRYGAHYSPDIIDDTKFAPKGWHVASPWAEWETLQNYLIANGYNWDGTTTGNKIAKSLAAKADWVKCTQTGTIGCDLTKNNRTGFSAYPGGYTYHKACNAGPFMAIGGGGFWWNSSAGCSDISSNMESLNGDNAHDGYYTFPVRLIRD